MGKLLLMSGFLAMVILPIRAARLSHPGRALRRSLGTFVLYNALYWVLVLFVYFQLVLGPNPEHLLNFRRY